ncbi:MAG: tetratricopeptide repeat protein [Ignavibacteria bacterium]|nr:tetratricopeptide repeat protein [Ignavibacteria bacterium]
MKYIRTILVLIALVLIGCSKRSEKNYLDSASEKMRNNDISGCIVEYQKLIQDYPSSLNSLAALDSLIYIYQNGLEKSLSRQAAQQKVVECYSTISKNFPESDQGKVAMFMVGFIQANELQQYDAAKKSYQAFLDKNPNHPMAPAARTELENIGKSAEDILKSAKGI